MSASVLRCYAGKDRIKTALVHIEQDLDERQLIINAEGHAKKMAPARVLAPIIPSPYGARMKL